jgi:tetratricopeptide (TPR) repeat protein
VLLEPARPWARNALVFGATALATIVIVLGVKVIRGPKPPATAESAKGAAPAAQPKVPDIDPLPAARPAEPPVVTPAADPEPAARPAPSPAVAMKVAPAREAPAQRVEVRKTAPAKAAPVAHKRGAGNHKVKVARGGKVAGGKGARARKLAMRQPAAKQSAPTPPPERADPRPPYERGNALLFANDGKGAIAAYREAVRSAPSDPIGFRGLGLAYEHEGETALAIKALRHYLKLAPDAPDRAIIARRIDRLSKRAKKK